MPLEQKPLYLTLNSNGKFVFSSTASAVGYNFADQQQLYFNTGSGDWETIPVISASQGTFESVFSGRGVFDEGLSGSVQKLSDGTTNYLTAGTNVSLSTGSNGQVTIAATVTIAGPWTPALDFSTTPGTTTQAVVGTYVKVGTMVTANFSITFSDTGTLGTGNITLTGLPFLSQTTALGAAGTVVIPFFANVKSAADRIIGLNGIVQSNSTAATLYHFALQTSDAVILTANHFTTSTQLIGQVTYFAAV